MSGIDAIVRDIQAGEVVSPHVLFGPAVWQSGEGGERRWYFTVGGSDREGFFVDRVICGDEADAVEMRARLRVALAGGGLIVIHDFDDELEMMRWAEAIWPCEKARGIRVDIERERAGG